MSDLKERYIYAVVKGLPRGSRGDIERELSTLIDDMLEARVPEGTPTEKDLRVVLTELGTPAELHKKYNPDGEKALIGPEYYPVYKLTMGIVMAATVFGMTLSSVLAMAAGEGSWLTMLGTWVSGVVGGLIFAFGIVTMIFAVFERKKVKLELPSDTLENLPPVPRKQEIIPRGESVMGMVLCVLFLVVFLGFPQVMMAVVQRGGEVASIPVFAAAGLRAQWMWIALFGLAGLVRNALRIAEGRHTMRLMAVTIVCDVVSVPMACAFLLGEGIVNPAFTAFIAELFAGKPAQVFWGLYHFNELLLAVILFALLLDMGTTIFRTLRARH
jgi:hypothetical protein